MSNKLKTLNISVLNREVQQFITVELMGCVPLCEHSLFYVTVSTICTYARIRMTPANFKVIPQLDSIYGKKRQEVTISYE